MPLDLYDMLREASGSSESGPRIPRTDDDRVVRETPDMQRIVGLPRRVWQQAADLPELVQRLTAYCALPAGQQKLRPVQAVALREIYEQGGAFIPVRVGGGKTLISLLAPLVLQSKRPLLLVPASLLDKTKREARELALHWRIPPITILSYEKISRASKGWLAEQAFDLVIADECQKLRHTSAAVTKQVRRIMTGKTPPMFVCMSGSITARGLRDFRHLLVWALRKHAPIPSDAFEGMMWSLALDEKIPEEQRARPGALLRIDGQDRHATGDREEDRRLARNLYRDRLTQTPGVVTTAEDVPQVGLELRLVQLRPSQEVIGHLQTMRDTWCTPDGHPFETPLDLWRHALELACGEFFYRWDPRPPEEWIHARREWSKFVRDALSRSRTYDSPMHLVRAIHAGELNDQGTYKQWEAVRHTFKPVSVPVPLSATSTVLDYATEWLKANPDTGLVWVQHRYAGERLSARTGVPYFGRNAEDKMGNPVDKHQRSAIVSIPSCHAGRNLQRWNANLVLSPPTIGSVWEQLLGRTHRDGQEADTVTVDVVAVVREQFAGIHQALLDATYTQETTGQPQKLLYANRLDWPDLSQLLQSDTLL